MEISSDYFVWMKNDPKSFIGRSLDEYHKQDFSTGFSIMSSKTGKVLYFLPNTHTYYGIYYVCTTISNISCVFHFKKWMEYDRYKSILEKRNL